MNLWHALLIGISIPVMLLVGVTSELYAQGDPTLRDVLTEDGCQLACFKGIEPGVTTRDELETILDELGLSFEITTIGIGSDINTASTLQYIFYPSGISPYIASDREALIVVGQVAELGPIIIPLEGVTVDMVIGWFGEPTRIADLSYGSDSSYALVFPAQGLVFQSSVLSVEEGTLYSVRLNSEHLTNIGYDSFPNVESCTNFPELCPVLETSSPISSAGPDQTLTDTDSSGSELVTLDGSGSSDPDGTIVGYSWTENEVEIATGATPTVELAVGVHTITLTVTDDDDLTASDEVVVTVEAAPKPRRPAA